MHGKFGIKVIFYRVRADDHSALTRLLQALVPATVAGAPPAGSLSPSPDAIDDEVDPLPTDQSATTVVGGTDVTDPHKGAFGGSPTAGGFTLSAETIEEVPGRLRFRLIVSGSEGAQLATGEEVIFHLHPTFPAHQKTVQAVKGRATLRLKGYGAFTVGAELPERNVRLELDLAEVETLPAWFRER